MKLIIFMLGHNETHYFQGVPILPDLLCSGFPLASLAAAGAQYMVQLACGAHYMDQLCKELFHFVVDLFGSQRSFQCFPDASQQIPHRSIPAPPQMTCLGLRQVRS